ncbi:MAG: TIGR01777 family oxidoreductase [Acidobacteriota bacterium]
MIVVVTGATGFFGKPLVTALRARGDEVRELSRGGGADLEVQGPWMDAIDGTDAVIHLAGEPIAAKRWDARRKQLIKDSRVEGTRHLVLAIERARVRPRVLVSASGVDYYPYASDIDDFDDDEVTEHDPPGDEFLARVCKAWEAEARAAEALGVRVVIMRMGLVLAADGGALARMKPPAGRIGSGRQWLSWIHRDDAIAAYLAAIDDERYRGPINLVADSTRQAEFAKALPGPRFLPVPAFAIRAAVGELADSLLEGRRVVPARLRELGFTWTHPTLASALGRLNRK